MKYVIHFIACLLTLWMACQLFPMQAGYSSVAILFLGAAVLSLLYQFLRPVLQLLCSPISLITCGLFVFIINAGFIKLTDIMVGGIWLQGFWLCVGMAVVVAMLDRAMSWVGKLVRKTC